MSKLIETDKLVDKSSKVRAAYEIGKLAGKALELIDDFSKYERNPRTRLDQPVLLAIIQCFSNMHAWAIGGKIKVTDVIGSDFFNISPINYYHSIGSARYNLTPHRINYYNVTEYFEALYNEAWEDYKQYHNIK